MSEVALIIIFIQIIILLIIIILTWIYALSIIFIQSVHTPTNVSTCNVCLGSFFCCLYWRVDNIFYGFDRTVLNKYTISCTIDPYFQMMVNCLFIYALTTIIRFIDFLSGNFSELSSRTSDCLKDTHDLSLQPLYSSYNFTCILFYFFLQGKYSWW